MLTHVLVRGHAKAQTSAVGKRTLLRLNSFTQSCLSLFQTESKEERKARRKLEKKEKKRAASSLAEEAETPQRKKAKSSKVTHHFGTRLNCKHC